jgi:endonuclease/exonuclease/phosphatase (EEP) superfamily protein YafD
MTLRLTVAALVSGALVVPAPASAARTEIKVMSANVKFGKGSAKRVKRLFNHAAERADIVFLQEARDVKVTKRLTGPGWAIRQDKSTPATRGAAVVIRKASVKRFGKLILTPAVQGHPCGLGDRFIASVPVLLDNGTRVRATSLHMPPRRCDTPGGPYSRMAQNVVAFANRVDVPLLIGGDWNKVVDQDPNGIAARSSLMPRGMNGGSRIDGFLIERRPATKAGEPVRLADFGSDHQPLLLRVSVR